MNNLKRLLIGMLALVLMLPLSYNVAASTVPSKQGRYVIEELNQRYLTLIPSFFSSYITTITPDTPVEEVLELLTENGVPGSAELISIISNRKFFTPFFDVIEEPAESLTTENVDILIYVPGISKYTSEQITIICYNVVTQQLETLNFTFEGEDVISVHFNNLSPLAIVVDESGPIEDKSSDIKVVPSSPKTGSNTPWAYLSLAALLLFLCSFTLIRTSK